jgi:leucyl aminopeptidase
MKIHLDFTAEHYNDADVKVLGSFQKTDAKTDSKKLVQSWEEKELAKHFNTLKAAESFTGAKGTSCLFTGLNGETIIVVGLGDKTKAKAEEIRRAAAAAYKAVAGKKYKSVALDAGSFNAINDKAKTMSLLAEGIKLTAYNFDKYQSTKNENSFKQICFYCAEKKVRRTAEKLVLETENLTDSVNVTRDLVNEAPNVLHSVEYAKRVEKDVKTALKGKGVKTKILGKADLKKEKMGLFLAVNAGSAHEPRLVHLTYTPKKVTKNTKHICLVGKGLTFDTGGYSLKPAASMVGMKFDMGGSATVYGAFRAAVLNNSPYKITCILGMTDNAVNEHATMPDSIVKGRSGKTVEILNTDAEGRLVLADCLDYASDLKPDMIIDAATLTGACLVALGTQVCAVLGNDDKFINKVKKSADAQDEYMWQLPIIPEWRDDMKSKIADLKNIGSTRFAGTATAAAFLENFIGEGIQWAHLDIAGVCDSASFLPYCPAKGGSGLIVRSLHHLLVHGK